MHYYVNDMYGSVRTIVRNTSVLTRLIEYYPYGQQYSVSGGGSVYTFLGKGDPGIGMHDFGPRYYNATLGRFMSPDPILAGPSAYSYAEGNPVMLYDPTGMWAQAPSWPSSIPDTRTSFQKYGNACEGAYGDRLAGWETRVDNLERNSMIYAVNHAIETGQGGLVEVTVGDETFMVNELIADAAKASLEDERVVEMGVTINANNAFRTTSKQAALYEASLDDPKVKAAPPGTSMHEAGLAFDVHGTRYMANEELQQLGSIAGEYGFNHGYKSNDFNSGINNTGGRMHFEADPVALGYGGNYRGGRQEAIRQTQTWYYRNEWSPGGGWISPRALGVYRSW